MLCGSAPVRWFFFLLPGCFSHLRGPTCPSPPRMPPLSSWDGTLRKLPVLHTLNIPGTSRCCSCQLSALRRKMQTAIEPGPGEWQPRCQAWMLSGLGSSSREWASLAELSQCRISFPRLNVYAYRITPSRVMVTDKICHLSSSSFGKQAYAIRFCGHCGVIPSLSPQPPHGTRGTLIFRHPPNCSLFSASSFFAAIHLSHFKKYVPETRFGSCHLCPPSQALSPSPELYFPGPSLKLSLGPSLPSSLISLLPLPLLFLSPVLFLGCFCSSHSKPLTVPWIHLLCCGSAQAQETSAEQGLGLHLSLSCDLWGCSVCINRINE